MAITETLVICPSCGRRHDEPTHFCVDCGTRLPDSGDANQPETEPENGSDKASTKPLRRSKHRMPTGRPPPCHRPRRLSATGRPLTMPPRPTTEPAQTPPPSSAGKRSGRPILIGIALPATLVLVVLGVALYVGGVFGSTGSASPATSNSPASSAPTPSVAARTPTPAPVPTAPSAKPSPSPAVPPVVRAPGVTRRDARGFNITATPKSAASHRPAHAATAVSPAILSQPFAKGSIVDLVQWGPQALPQIASELKDVGANWDRVDLSWAQTEPSKGQFRWGHMDQTVRIANRYGIRLLPVLGYAPKWTQPEDAQGYASFVAAVVKRYGPGTEANLTWFELWNEPTYPTRGPVKRLSRWRTRGTYEPRPQRPRVSRLQSKS